MYSFKNDYAEGAHPLILKKLLETNSLQQAGYSEDEYSNKAKEQLRNVINNPQAAIYFATAGTQTNALVIASLLRTHEAVICANSGHIYVNETGAIESSGHKVIAVASHDGKLTPILIQEAMNNYLNRPHVVKPRLVYISNSTELGTIYSKAELTEIAHFCKKNNLLLFMDGARLGSALTASGNDLTLADIASLLDVFYIGGTKNGALLGEAIIFKNNQIEPDFDYMVKQKGALLAKGRILGIQFLELFKEQLFFKLSAHANKMAMKISSGIRKNGYTFLSESNTNQIFPILPNQLLEKLQQDYQFTNWKKIDEQHTTIRLVTSWATDEKKVDEFIEAISAFNR